MSKCKDRGFHDSVPAREIDRLYVEHGKYRCLQTDCCPGVMLMDGKGLDIEAQCPKCSPQPNASSRYASIVDYVVSEIAPEMTRLLEQGLVGKADDWADERADVLARFTAELAKATGDGSKKRQAGEKPPWYEDDAHEGAMFSHLTKWKRGELVDPDSGGHPLVHLAWRALAIACRETGNVPS
jgi:hypothetical protein